MNQIGRYRILEELGRGNMGVVYRAEDPVIGRQVAIKVIHLREAVEPSEIEFLRRRLYREAQSAGKLSHPGIVTIYQVAEQDETAFIAMEFVSGLTLESILDRPEAPPQQIVLNAVQQTAAALDYAHRKGIVHRDIKPANVMIDEDSVVKICDFGVAKIQSGQRSTQTGFVLGTPCYMAPEQIRGETVDGAADQFSLAVVIYEMLGGLRPFRAETLTSLIYKVLAEEPRPINELNPTLDQRVAGVMKRALAKNRADRFPSCTEFANALTTALAGSGDWQAAPRRTIQEEAPPATPEPSTAPVVEATLEEPLSVRRIEMPEAPPLAPAAPAKRFPRTKALVAAGLSLVALVALIATLWRAPVQRERITANVVAPTIKLDAPPTIKHDEPQPSLVETVPQEPSKTPEKPRKTTPSAPQPLTIATVPDGATVIVNGDRSTACTSPCSIPLATGRHTISVEAPGYRRELRIIETGGKPKELSVELTKAAGTVVIESDPPGARILINGQPHPEATPARVALPPGKYTIAVVSGGRRSEQAVEIQDRGLAHLSFRP